jgi:hypothetical protein
MEEWYNFLRKSTLKGLTAYCVRGKIKMMKTVYSQEVNTTVNSKKSGAGTNDLHKPQLVWFDILTWFLWNSVSYEANSFIIVGILDTPSWLLSLLQFLTQTDLFFFLLFPTKLIFHSTGKQQLHGHQLALLLWTPFYFIMAFSELA